tara:strand:- start:70298 stop:70624 length:327 start_codon:yes stop_codon:yes gene_type:complete
MPIHPEPLNQFFDASNTKTRKMLISCFSEDAVVKDEGKTHTGKQAISIWTDLAISTYQPSYQVLSIKLTSLGADVVAMVSGSFLGSPIELSFQFALTNNLITQLEIKL